MSHYDGECKYCKAFGMFRDIDCSCPEFLSVKAERKAKLDAEYAEARAFLVDLKYPIFLFTREDNEQTANRVIETARWARGLLEGP